MTSLVTTKSNVRFRRPTLRVQLTLLYSGLAIALCAVALAATGLLIRQGSSAKPGSLASAIANANAQRAADMHQFGVAAAVIFAIAAALALGIGWWLAGRLLRPLRAITAVAQDISANNLHERLHLEGPDDELRQLGKTLDDLFARLEDSFEAQRHFVANASHELRTPLAGQRTLLQVALADPDASAEALRLVCEESLQLGEIQEQLIDALLTLATSERGVERWEPFDLGSVAESALLVFSRDAERRGIRVDVALGSAPSAGDPRLVERLVVNLVDNALRHNVNGGRVEISTVSAPGRATINVSNTGPALSSEQVERLFLPFQQVGVERVRHTDGHGLGLTIVRAIAHAHSAEINARPRSDGGLDISVIFISPERHLP